MQVAIHNYRADLTEALQSYVERRLKFALSRFGGRVGRITVRICADGPAEHNCRVSAEILPFGRIAVEESDADLFAAVDRATALIGRRFGRELARAHEARLGRETIRAAA